MLAAAVALAAAAACGESDGATRALPDSERDGDCPERVPLVVDLHGYNANPDLHAVASGWRYFGAQHGIVVVTPTAGREPPRWDHEADIDLLADVIDVAIAERCADPARVYLTGHSQGGFLISHAVCELADRIAAAAPVAGVRHVEGCEPDRPVPVIVTHSTGDDVVLFDGGLHPYTADVLDLPVEGPSIPEITAAWAARNGCAEGAEIDADPADPRVTVHRWPCPEGAEVELRAFDGGGHEWPAGATEAIWAFFEQHALADPAHP